MAVVNLGAQLTLRPKLCAGLLISEYGLVRRL